VGTGVKDMAGNALGSAISWNFTTVVKWIGTKQFGTPVSDIGYGITSDSSGNIYVSGFTSGGLDGNTSAGGTDLFVIKYNSTGVKQWTQQLGTSGDDQGRGITSDTNGNVYVIGVFSGDFVVKYNSSGVKQWTQQLENVTGMDIASDSGDNIYAIGYTSGDLEGNTSAGGIDLFVVKYNSSGVKQWTRQVGTSGNDYGYGITIDSNSNVYVTGSVNSNGRRDDLFVVKYNSSGVKQWTQQVTVGTDYSWGLGITSDSDGNVYVTGATFGDLDGNTNAGGRDLILIKYNSSGMKQWTQQLGISGNEEGRDIVSDSDGNIYVTGYTAGSLDGNTNAGSNDIILVKYSSVGVKQWTRQVGTSENDIGYGITIDSNSNVYLTGSTIGDLDGNTNDGETDFFVIKYNSDGVKQ